MLRKSPFIIRILFILNYLTKGDFLIPKKGKNNIPTFAISEGNGRMKAKDNISRGEQHILNKGLFVAVPINLLIVLKQSERDVLTVIRHMNNIGKPIISYSLFRLYTGQTDKTVREAIKSLERMGIVEVGKVCKKGTRYSVNYKVLNNILDDLYEEGNPVKRLEIADRFRGVGYELNSTLIRDYKDSEFDVKH